MLSSLEHICKLIQNSKDILISTHKQCDGDGLGAQLGLYHALQNANKNVKVINVDEVPLKYSFLDFKGHIQDFTQNRTLPASADLCLIFDTNDERLIEPLFSELKKICKKIAFIDHHPVLKKGPLPSQDSWIDVTCASTGEMAYKIIKSLGLSLNLSSAKALYTSVAFDTQLFKYVRNSAMSHVIAAEALQFDIHPAQIIQGLFGRQTKGKMAFLGLVLQRIEYLENNRLAVLRLNHSEMKNHSLEADDLRDIIDFLMGIEEIEAAAVFREDAHETFKLSLRSKGLIDVLSVAEEVSGGGHVHAAGAYLYGPYEKVKSQVVQLVLDRLRGSPLR